MKRFGIITLVFLLNCSFNSGAAQVVSASRGRELLKRGSYKEAVQVFTSLLEKSAVDKEAIEGLARAQIETGDYAIAEKRVRDFLAAQPAVVGARAALGEIMFETGRYAEAASEFERAARDARGGNEKGAAWLNASLGRARALRAQGKEAESRPLLEEIVQAYNSDGQRSAEELVIIAQALAYLEKYKDANELFKDAREADPTFIDAFIGQGELFNEKYQYGDAASLFQDALKINPNSARSLVGLAESKRYESNEAPSAAVNKALGINPNYPVALALRARLDLEADNPDEADKSVERALKVNPNLIEALAVRASIYYLADRKAELEAETRRALAVNPRAGDFFDTLAHFAVNNRRYMDAVEFGRRAVELSPRLWSARTQLGIQLLRVGKMAEGRAELERAFEGDRYNIWAKNTLDLLDSMREFVDTVRGPFLVKAASTESNVIAAYAADLLEEAHKKLTAKYRFTPRAPIAVELFANHEDFAVRALGVPGLGGALGVCFGQLIAMDSPSAREKGQFNWGETLWHEYAHVVTLQMTDYRIPRWFSEGLSVYEERRARQGWSDNWTFDRLKAFTGGRFVKIDDLDGAFIRPRSADGVALAYFQASLVCEFVEERFGFDGILRMLALYKEGAKTPDVFQRALKMTFSDFDAAFNDYLLAKTRPYVEAVGTGPIAAPGGQGPTKEALIALIKARPNDYFANLKLGSLYKVEGDTDRAIEHLRKAAEAFPFYAQEGNPYGQLADIYEARGEKLEAVAALESLTRHNETDVEAYKRLARLRVGMNDRAGAIETLKLSFFIHPFDASLHKLAGDVYLEQGNAAEATREFRVLVALNPPDTAAAHYDLARSLEASGNRAEARREVLRALEIAPGFEKAQELLLKLRGAS